MQELRLKITDSKFPFFMELIKSLDFVQIDTDGDSKASIISNITKGLKEVKLSKQGKLKTTPAKDFLNDL